MKHTAVLLLSTPVPLARKGVVAAITQFLVTHNGSILHADDHVDSERGMFLSRLEWDLDGFDIPITDFGEWFKLLAEQYSISYHLAPTGYRPKVVILVSGYDHCVADLLYRYKSGELACEIVTIISNHSTAKPLADFYGVRFHLQYLLRTINVHHSFLPAFIGATPYHQAFDRGVKLIGATSHYVTATLDDGPIIEQDVVHRDTVEDMLRKGRDLEKVVLARSAGTWKIVFSSIRTRRSCSIRSPAQAYRRPASFFSSTYVF